MSNNNAVLSQELSKEFKLVGWLGGTRQNFGKFGIVNLKTLTPAQADSLIQRGFKKLARKDAKADPPSKGK